MDKDAAWLGFWAMFSWFNYVIVIYYITQLYLERQPALQTSTA
jgi:hypothetical protein